MVSCSSSISSKQNIRIFLHKAITNMNPQIQASKITRKKMATETAIDKKFGIVNLYELNGK